MVPFTKTLLITKSLKFSLDVVKLNNDVNHNVKHSSRRHAVPGFILSEFIKTIHIKAKTR